MESFSNRTQQQSSKTFHFSPHILTLFNKSHHIFSNPLNLLFLFVEILTIQLGAENQEGDQENTRSVRMDEFTG